MSATVQQFNFAGKAEGIVSALEDARRAFEEAVALAAEIADAVENGKGTHLRLETGLVSEARSLQGYINEMFPGLELDSVLREGRDLQALVQLACDVEAVAS